MSLQGLSLARIEEPSNIHSPELVAQLGQDYTVYAYDYSEYETPLVGQGMLSWVLASSSPTPNAPAHQSRTMVTGRVCRNVLGLFSKGAQETLEVKLRLVPVPTVMQSEYIDSMQRYRELSNMIPHEFDAQTWTNFLRQNPGILGNSKSQQPDRATSPMDHAGIEKFHQLLSAGSTPREFPSIQNEPFRSTSPPQSTVAGPSRHSTPGGNRPSKQPQLQQFQHNSANDTVRPSSSASMRESDLTNLAFARRGSIQSGYGSADESLEQPRKRAKLYRAEFPGRSDLNIEKQPSSLRVAASTAASVRIHRPTPMNPSIAAAQNSSAEPIRPPTPIAGSNDIRRKARPPPSLLREQSEYTSPYPMSDDQPSFDPNSHSPEEPRYQGLFEPSFSMPSSPPIADYGFPGPSSPALPPIATDPDSGFMSGGLEDLLDDDLTIPLDDCGRNMPDGPKDKRTVRPSVRASSPVAPTHQSLSGDGSTERAAKEAPSLPRAPSVAGSRPSSRASARPTPRPLAPAPMSQSDIEQIMSAVPASDPIMPQPTLQHSHSWAGPMSDFPTETPAPQTEDPKVRTGSRRVKQVQARLDKCIREGQVPPYCGNCGAIETPTWRRAWSKEVEGSEEVANELAKDPTMLFWQAMEKDDQDKVTKFKIIKKTLLDTDKDFATVLLCNRKYYTLLFWLPLTSSACGIWLHKFKTMRPENKWNKSSSNKRKRPPRRKGPLNGGAQPIRRNSKAQSGKLAGSSPATDASSPQEGTTPHPDNDDNDDDQDPPSKRRRANSVEPRRSSDTAQSRWQEQDPMEALRRAIQSSPIRNREHRNVAAGGKDSPKSVRRVLFPNSHSTKPLGETSGNSPRSARRSPRVTRVDKQAQDKENQAPATDDIDCLFESPTFDFDLPASPTPKRRNTRGPDKRAPTQSPGTVGTRKEDSDLTPTKLSAQKLQRIQGTVTTPTRLSKTPKRSQTNGTELAPLPESFDPEELEGVDNVVANMFDNDSDFFFDPSRCQSGTDWVGWFTSDGASAIGSDEGQNREQDSGDFISSIFDPEMQRKNLNFDPFALDDSTMLDPGLFGTDSLNQDVMIMGSTEKSTDGSAAK